MELYIPIERPQYNPTNGQFLKGHVPHNKGKKWEDYMDMRKAKRIVRIAKQNLKPNMKVAVPSFSVLLSYRCDRTLS